MGKLIYLNNETRLDIPAERVLTAAIDAELTGVVVMGWDKDGDPYLASSIADGGDVLWLMEVLKRKLFGD